MCGIVGAVTAHQGVVSFLIEGLRRLEYRGYDSAGVALLQDQKLKRVRSTGRVIELQQRVHEQQVDGCVGIAHTRWATHGAPTEKNAHPHASHDSIAVVHNGIIENYETLRKELESKGYVFSSDTDTEVVAHLIHSINPKNILSAVKQAIKQLRGAYAIAVVNTEEPDRVVCARLGSPLVLGLAAEGHFIASDASALQPVTRNIVYLEDGDVLSVEASAYTIFDKNDTVVTRPVRESHIVDDVAELGPYQHFMQKEIFEQPTVVSDTLEGVQSICPKVFGNVSEILLPKVKRVLILACGTSYHAGMITRYWMEHLAGIPCQVEIASEYRYRESVMEEDTLVVAISQSGETADTLAAFSHALTMSKSVMSLAICNVPQSSLVRLAQLVYLTRAGVEVSVASTKAFTTQLAALFLLVLTLTKVNGKLTEAQEKNYLNAFRHLPIVLQSVLAQEPQIVAWAERFQTVQHTLFLGRGIHFPVALEGSLKLKEISYIHAEGYPAGELKHGPLALVDEQMPIVVLAPNDGMLEKLKSNIQEVRARGGELYVLADREAKLKSEDRLHVIEMPEVDPMLSPIVYSLPLQLLSYYVAVKRGTDVDRPRNLAKSVTVE
ncbi:MAG: glutamine--fructose-6-phosphate transaminase (isomerizing) [Pseudomonadota bacterium]